MDFTCIPHDDNKLDSDFRRILCIIKEHIQYVNSTHNLSLYRSWLEKLSTASDEKEERNIYLLELARQVKGNKLLPPFNRPPLQGPLRNLPKINLFKPSEIENVIHGNTEIKKERLNYQQQEPQFAEDKYQLHLMNQSQRNVHFVIPNQNFCRDDYTPRMYMEPPDCCYYHPCFAEKTDDTTEVSNTTEVSDTPKKQKKKKTKSLQKLITKESSKIRTEIRENKEGKSLNPPSPSGAKKTLSKVELKPNEEVDSCCVKDDSSWCDLSDVSQTSVNVLASGDSQKCPPKPKIQEKSKQSEEIKTLVAPKIKNKKKESSQDLFDKHKEPEKHNRKTYDFNQSKIILKDTNFISLDWKKTIDALQMRLTETLHQNNDLKSIINALQVKLKEEVSKNKDQNDLKQMQTEMCKRELESLHQKQSENVKKLEKSFSVKLTEAEKSYQHKIEKLSANYETKIKEMQVSHEYSKKEKDQEMIRLSEIIQQQCVRMSNEISALRNQIEMIFNNNDDSDKIIVLQKCVSKMDKLFQRSEKDYQKQIDKLKQELDLKDKVTQIQLKTQRAELITRTSVERQKQFDEVINNLEFKYIKMLESHEYPVMHSKGKDEEKIANIKHLLSKYHVDYNTAL